MSSLSTMKTLGLVLVASLAVNADVYMHNPRGSNNRLNEQSANRNNGNRMFDSQNNNRGGYNKGDVDDNAAGNDFQDQYDMGYYESDADVSDGGKSELTIEWTNQHGCGGNEQNDEHKLNCEIIIQYMCTPHGTNQADAQTRYKNLDFINQAPGYEDGTTNPDYTAATYTETGKHNPLIDGADHVLQKPGAESSCFIKQPTNPTCVPITTENMATMMGCTTIDGFDEAACNSWDTTPGAWQGNLLWKADPYKVDNAPALAAGTADTTAFHRRRFRDGVTTNRQQFTTGNQDETQEQRAARKNGDVDEDEGLHESWEWYDECYRRERNQGLFTADQNLRNNAFGYSSAIYTRQNPNNNRRGYECPEERDYWPYWHPSPWVDIAVLTDRMDRCAMVTEESQNVKPKHVCRNTADNKRCVRWNNELKCKEEACNWIEVAPHNKPKPECIQSPWSRVNHLGNGRYGEANSYNWTIPHFGYDMKCMVRLRYNISTDDYDGALTNSSFNQNNGQGIQSPVRQNPNVDIGTINTALRLAINTAQFGRTFQDRSHVLHIKARPNDQNGKPKKSNIAGATGVQTQDFMANTDIYNLNVRGKRCNIVQCFPSVEYDFIPNKLAIVEGDAVHIQWTGSNTHNNGNPAGDGQAGDAGEGTRGTDRHNIVEMMLGSSPIAFGGVFPATFSESKMFKMMNDVYHAEHRYHTEDMAGATTPKTFTQVKTDIQIKAATAGYLKGYNENTLSYEISESDAGGDVDDFDVLLNNAPASFPGFLAKFSTGSYNYMCTRNNNFSNRNQQGHIRINPKQ